MPQDLDEEQKAQMPFDAKIALKVDELRRVLDAQKSSMQPRIATLQEQKLQLQRTLDLINEAPREQIWKGTSV